MSRAGWERQALNSIQSVLGNTDPKLASQLAGFSRLAAKRCRRTKGCGHRCATRRTAAARAGAAAKRRTAVAACSEPRS
jgi:hypothetical protein